MKSITRKDLENAITQAQYTVCVQHLRDLRCPMCQAPKEYYRCFCRTCYFALPEEMRAPLWIERRTPPDLEIFVTGYLAAKDFLRRITKIIGNEPGLVRFDVPLIQPSVNHYKLPNGRGGFYKTKESQAFIDAVCMVGRTTARTLPVAGEFYAVELTVYVHRKKFLRGDSDNMEKVAFDALTHAGLIKDDRYITRHTHHRVPVDLAAQERTEYVIIGREEP